MYKIKINEITKKKKNNEKLKHLDNSPDSKNKQKRKSIKSCENKTECIKKIKMITEIKIK